MEKKEETNCHTNLTPTVKEFEALLEGANRDTCKGSDQLFALPRMVEVDSEVLGKEEDVAADKETGYFEEIANQDPTLHLEVEQENVTMEVEGVQIESDVPDSQNSVMSTEEDLHCKNDVHQEEMVGSDVPLVKISTRSKGSSTPIPLRAKKRIQQLNDFTGNCSKFTIFNCP